MNIFTSGSFDNTIKIWDLKNMELIETIEAHDSNVICVIQLKDLIFIK